MPFTPYHFGPNGFVGLVFKKWLDLPAFILVNIIIDFEVLFNTDQFAHRVWHFHTLLVGGIVGAAFGLALFPFRSIFEWLMSVLRLSYKPTFLKMMLGGLLGAWFHVAIDGIYHWDVQMFWPNRNYRPLWNLLSQPQVRYICLAFALAAIALYVLLLALKLRKQWSR
jgi:membrane-bound metal-dependent hydrolase YbcI (DUF457 family)